MLEGNTKTDKLLNDLSIITICLAKLCVSSRPLTNELTFVSVQCPIRQIAPYASFMVATDLNLP